MPSPSTDSLLDALRRLDLLPAAQLQQFTQRAQQLNNRGAISRELTRLGLSPLQIELLLADRAAELIVGSYKLVDRLGGPQGQVYRARHLRMSRTVALKVLRPDKLASADSVAQFYREVETVSRLSHPHLVHAFDAGPVGETHFLATEFIPGHDLARLVAEKGKLAPDKAREYIRQAAAGLAHAHRHGLVHLGLKPSKLLLTEDGKAKLASSDTIVKVLDVGLTHRVNRAVEFRAPEQRAGQPSDTRADVYSLGAILYLLLSGKPPATLPYGSTTQFPLAQEIARLPADLAKALKRMLATAPDERFADMTEVVEALGGPTEPDSQTMTGLESATLALGNESPSMAGLPSDVRSLRIKERARARWRQRMIIGWGGGGVLVGMVLLVGMLSLGGHPLAVPTPPETENNEAPVAETPEVTLQAILARKEAGEHPAKLWRNFLDLRLQHPTAPEALTATAWLGKLLSPLDRLSEDRVSADDRQFADIARGKGLVAVLGDHRLRIHYAGTLAVALAPSGKWVATCSAGDSLVTVWDTATGKRVHRLKVDAGQPLALAFSPDEKLLAVGSQHNALATVRAWHIPAGTKMGDMNPAGAVHRLVFGPKPGQLIVGSTEGVRIFDLSGKAPVRVNEFPEVKPVTELSLSADGKMLAVTVPKGKTARLIDLTQSKLLDVKLDHPAELTGLAISPDGQRIATTGKDKEVRLWAPDGTAKGELKGSPTVIHALVFAHDGKSLYSGAEDGRVTTWDLETNKSAGDLPAALTATNISGLSLGGRGTLLAASGWSGNGIGLWDLEKKAALLRPASGHTRAATAVAFSPDEQTLASIGEDWALRFWDLSQGEEGKSAPKPAGPLRALAYSADGKTLFTIGHNGALEFRLPDGSLIRSIPPGAARSTLAMSPDGTMLASGSVGGNVEIWRLDAGDKPQHILKAHPNDRSLGVALSFSPDGKFLATCSGLDKNAKIWSTESGDLVTSLPHTIPPTSVAFAPDGRTLYTADGDGKIRTWEAPTWKSGLVIVADLSKDQGLSLAPSPDGRYLAVGVSKRATIRVFELPSAGPPRDVRSWTLPCFTQSVSFAADSRHLAVPAVNGVIYLFRMGPAGS